MGLKSYLIKIAIKMTPNIVVLLVANIILKGIAKLSDFTFDLDSRSAYVRVTLYGEEEPIEVSVDGFAIVSDGEDSHHLIIQQAKSNRLWLNNIFSRIVGKAWKIPDQPQHRDQIELVAELFKDESPENKDS